MPLQAAQSGLTFSLKRRLVESEDTVRRLEADFAEAELYSDAEALQIMQVKPALHLLDAPEELVAVAMCRYILRHKCCFSHMHPAEVQDNLIAVYHTLKFLHCCSALEHVSPVCSAYWQSSSSQLQYLWV